MTAEQDYLVGLAAQVAAQVVQSLKDEGLVHDDRPLLSTQEAAARLGIAAKTMDEMLKGEGVYAESGPVIPSLLVGKGRRKVEPRAIDEYIEQQKRLAWSASREETNT